MPSRGTIETIYGMIVTQAREPLFYRDLGVPDTVNGRFDLLVLHLWMVLRRMRPMEARRTCPRRCSTVSARTWTPICAKWASATSTVPKRMRAFGEAFYGRAAAYDLALAAGHEPLAQAICKNILNGEHIEKARQLAVYAEAAHCRARGTGRRGVAGRIVEISLSRRIKRASWTAAMNRPTDMTDKPDPWRVPVTVAQDAGNRTASRHRGRQGRARRRSPRWADCAKCLAAQCVARRDAEERRPLPRRGAGAGAGRADLRGDARADRERDRRADRPDLRAAGANS